MGADEKAWCLASSRHLSKAIVGTQPVLRQTTVFIIYLLFIIHQDTVQKVYIKYLQAQKLFERQSKRFI